MAKAEKPASTTFIVFTAMLGHALESYDFYIYAFLTTVIAGLFFPQHDPFIAVIYSLAIFSAGYLIRPFGGVMFGYLADRYGRKRMFVISMFILVVVTVAMGLLPVYAQIGVWASMLMLILRLLQGFAFGGEFTGAVVYINENAPENREGFIGSWFMVAMATGYLLGSLITALTSWLIPQSEFLRWGWRIPFLMGGLTGIIATICRLYLKETTEFMELVKRGELSANPLLETIKTAKTQIAFLMGLSVLSTMGRVMFFAYLPFYLTTVGGLLLSDAALVSGTSALVFIFFSIFWGWLSDIFGRRLFLALGSLSLAIAAPGIFHLASAGTIGLSLIGASLYAILLSLYASPSVLIVRELFPLQIRSTSQSIGWNLVNSILGGTSLLICTMLIHITGSPLAPGYYVTLGGLVSFLTALVYKRHRKK